MITTTYSKLYFLWILNVFLLFSGTSSFAVPSDREAAFSPENLGAFPSKVYDGGAILALVPTFSNCPSDITNVSPNPGDCTANVTWTPPTATGSGPVTIESNYDPGDSFYPGTHRVIYRATDSNGTSFCEFTVEVLDNQAPVITVPADITTTADPGSCGAVVTFPFPNATDNCPAGEGAPIDENFDSGNDLGSQCYDFDGSFVGTDGRINGSAGEVETVELIQNDIRSFTSPLTRFNSTGEIFFDHRILSGHPSGNLGNNSRLTVKLITSGGAETVIFNEQYINEDVQTEYIEITQSGNFFVQFEWETDQNRSDIAYLDDLYIPGYIVSDITVVACAAAFHRVAQISGQPFRSGREFPVGTTTLEYITRDAAGNVGFNSFKVTVTNNINPPNGNDVEYCEGSPIPALTANVGAGQTVDWYDAAVGGTLLLADSTSYTPPGPGNYYAETRNTATGCVSSTRRRIRLIENPQPDPPVSPSPIEYCVGDTASQLTATGDPGNMIHWYDAATGGNMFASAPTPDTSTAGTTSYYVEQIDASTGCVSDRTQVDVIVYSIPLAPAVTSPVEYCVGDTANELNDSASGTDLKWYDAATGGNEIPGTTRPNTSAAGQQFFWVSQSSVNGSANCESTRSRLTVNVNTPPSISSQPSNRTICEGENTTFSVAAANAGSFQWQLFDGSVWTDLTNTAPYSGAASNTLTITAATTALSGNQYRAVVSSPAASCSDAVSNVVTLTVNTAPPAPVSGGDQTECEQNPIQTLTATATPPPGATVVWYDAAAGGNVVSSPNLSSVGSITYYAESNDSGNSCGSVGRTPVTLTIEPAPSAPVSGGDVTECEQDPVQTLTATAIGPAGSTVVWYDAASGGNLVASPELSSVGTITYYAQSNDDGTGCPSTSRTPVTLTIQPAPAAPLSGGDQTECETSPTQTLTATANVPSGFSVTWFDAASGGNVVGSPTLNSVGTVTYYAESTNDGTSCNSLSRTPVTLTIEPVPAAPTSGGDQTECEASPTQTMTATATAPSGVTVVWYDMPSGGSTVSPTLNSVGTVTYYAESETTASGCVSDSRTAVTLTMNSRPTLSVTPASQSCSPDLTTYSVSVDVNRGTLTSSSGTVTDNGGNNWTVSNVPSGNDITVTVTDANSCSETLSINAPNCSCPIVNAPTSGGDRTECENDPIQTLTATATPPAGANVVWYDAATNGNVVASPTLSTVGTITYYAESEDIVSGCTSSTRTPVSLTIQGAPAAPESGGDQTECQTSPTQTLTASANVGTGFSIVWYDAASGGNTVANPILDAVGTITYYAESVDNGTGCTSHSRTPVSLTIHSNPSAPTSGGDQDECEASPIQTLTASASAPSGSDVVWYDAASGGNTVVNPDLNSIGTVTYYAESRNNATGCTSTSRTAVSLTIRDTPDITETPASASCSPDLTTYSVSVDVSEGTVTSSEGIVSDNGGNNWTIADIPSGNNITVTVTSANSCTNNILITAPDCSCPTVDAPISGGDQTECAQTAVQTLTATATPPADATVRWYDAATAGNVVTNPVLNSIGNITYYAESRQNVTNCPSASRTAVTLTINPLPNVTANATATNVNAGEPVTLTGSGANSYVWDNGVNDGDTVFPLVTTTYTVIGTDANGCENTDSVTVTVSATSDLRLEKSVDNPMPNVGDTVTFTLTVTNDGPSDDTGGSVVRDILPNGYTYSSDTGSAANGTYDTASGQWTLPAIPNGNSLSIGISAIVEAPTGTPDQYVNAAEIIAATNFDSDSTPDNDDGDQSEDDEASVSVSPQVVDLEVTNTISSSTANPGEPLTLTVDVLNNGPDDATNVSIENYLPIGFTVTSIGNGGIQTGNTILWSGLNIPGGSSVTLTFEVSVNVPTNAADEYRNTVQVTASDQFDSDSAPNNDDGDQSEDDEDNTEIVLIPADLQLSKNLNAASNQNPNTGDTVVFELSVTNEGPGIATNVEVEDNVPIGYTVGTINNGGISNGNRITWAIPNLPVGTQTISYEVTLNAPTNSLGEYTNTAQVIASDQFDPDSTPNNDDGDQSEDDEAMFSVAPPTVDIEISKSVDRTQTFHGETLVFTVTATNNSTYDATQIGIEDALPDGYELVSHTADLGGYDESTATWEIPMIPDGETATLQMTVTVTEIDDYTNVAELIYVDQIDPNTSNDRAEATPQVTQAECLTVFNEFSPNDDGANDFFFIECIEQYPDSMLHVYNRWGNEVFVAKGYDNSWDGTSVSRTAIGSSDKLPVGTYYYTLETGDGSTPAKSGWLYISR